MRWRAAVCLVAVAVLMLASAVICQAEESKAAKSAARASLLGVWATDADPRGAITIAICHDDIATVTSFKKFSAAGFIDGGSFVGFCREVGPNGEQRHWMLNVVTDGENARADFSSAVKGEPARTEQWKRMGKFGHSATPPPGYPLDTDSLPKLGEYIYVEELPEAIEKIAPEYPLGIRQRGITGTVMIQALVGKDGLVKQTVVIKSVPELDEYAATAVKLWRFKPARSKGVPVAVWVAVPVKFTLE